MIPVDHDPTGVLVGSTLEDVGFERAVTAGAAARGDA